MDIYEVANNINRIQRGTASLCSRIGRRTVEMLEAASDRRAEQFRTTEVQSNLTVSDWYPGASDLALVAIAGAPVVCEMAASACRDAIEKVCSVARPPA